MNCIIWFLDDDNKMGIPLKRIQFKWRLSENISEEELKCKRDLFWETCMTYGVLIN